MSRALLRRGPVTIGTFLVFEDRASDSTLRGPETRATPVDCPAGGAWLGIRLSPGTFLPFYPATALIDRRDVNLPGVSILDTVHQAGYFDQAHLTRSLRRLIGETPMRLREHVRQLSFLSKTGPGG